MKPNSPRSGKFHKRAAQSHPSHKTAPAFAPGWLWLAGLAFLVLVFYWKPLTDPATSIHWDAVDVHYSSQKYFADRVTHGELPFWTPYLFSGFPFLADPQVGAWYPLNWPFFLAGITPSAIEVELAVHALLAVFGAWLLMRRFIFSSAAAATGALFYGLSGFFAEHSSHVGMFSTAAALPWLILCFDRALEGCAVRCAALGGLAGGTMILAGHFQTALYAFTGLALFGAARIVEAPRRAARVAAILAGIGAASVLISSVQTLPAFDLTLHSIRWGADYSRTQERVLTAAGVMSVLWPNATGVFDHPDGNGISPATYYLYSGFLLVPLALAGLGRKNVRVAGLMLTVLPLWYMFGPSGGLYRIFVLLPGFRNVRAPVHFWFVPVLGLALLASGGSSWVSERSRRSWLPLALLAIVFLDLFYWNSVVNPLAYARHSFADLYGNREELAREKVLATQPPLTRFDMPDLLTVFGPLNHPLDLELEAAYGYNPLELSSYAGYRAAEGANPRLRDGLGVARYLDTRIGAVVPIASALPRAYFAANVEQAKDSNDAQRKLATLTPGTTAIVEGAIAGVQADPSANAVVAEQGEQEYQIHYRATRRTLLKVASPYFPGWTASLDGRPMEILRVDRALMGVVALPGDHEILLKFHSRWFGVGAGLSVISLLVCCALAWRRWPLDGKNGDDGIAQT